MNKELDHIKAILLECESTGTHILENLASDRDKLVRVDVHLDGIQEDTKLHQRLLNRFKWSNIKSTAITICAIAGTVGVIIILF